MRTLVLVALLTLPSFPAKAQTPGAAPNFGLLAGMVFMWPIRPDAPTNPCLSLPPQGFVVPDGYEAYQWDDSSGHASCLAETFADFFGYCDKQYSQGKVVNGQECVCTVWRGCKWTDVPPEEDKGPPEEESPPQEESQ